METKERVEIANRSVMRTKVMQSDAGLWDGARKRLGNLILVPVLYTVKDALITRKIGVLLTQIALTRKKPGKTALFGQKMPFYPCFWVRLS